MRYRHLYCTASVHKHNVFALTCYFGEPQLLENYRGDPNRVVVMLMDSLCEITGSTPDVEHGLMLLQVCGCVFGQKAALHRGVQWS